MFSVFLLHRFPYVKNYLILRAKSKFPERKRKKEKTKRL